MEALRSGEPSEVFGRSEGMWNPLGVLAYMGWLVTRGVDR